MIDQINNQSVTFSNKNQSCTEHTCYIVHLLLLGLMNYSIIIQENDLPSGEATDFVQSRIIWKWYLFFWYGNTKFHPNLMNLPAIICRRHHIQWKLVKHLLIIWMRFYFITACVHSNVIRRKLSIMLLLKI